MLIAGSCQENDGRGPSDECAEVLRHGLVILHEHATRASALAAEGREFLDVKAATGIQVKGALALHAKLSHAQWALSMTGIAHVQSRVAGGDVDRNRARRVDIPAAAGLATEAVVRMIQDEPEIAAEVRRLGARMTAVCDGAQ